MLNANPDSSRNKLDVRPRWKFQTSNHVPCWYSGASSALTVWPYNMKTSARKRPRSMKMTR